MQLFRISGHSMEPAFHGGEYVVVRKNQSPTPGDIIVFRTMNSELFIKRVLKIEKEKYTVKGDNPHCAGESSETSKTITVPRENIIGKVWFR